MGGAAAAGAGGAGGASAAGGMGGGGGLSSLLGGLLGGMGKGGGGGEGGQGAAGGTTGGLFGLFGGGDTYSGKPGGMVHTQKVWGFDVPDLGRNFAELGRSEDNSRFHSALINQGKASEQAPLPEPETESGSISDAMIKSLGGKSAEQEMDKLDEMIQGLGKQEFMKNPYKKNYEL